MQSSIPYNGEDYAADNRAVVLDSAKQGNYSASTPKIVRSYDSNTGVYASPLSDPSSESVVIFHLHNKFGYSTAQWEASKTGAPPICPAPMDSYCSGDIIQSATINVCKPQADNSGDVIWSMGGTYTYIQGSVRDENSHYETGLSPYGEQRNLAGNNWSTVERPTSTNLGILGIYGGASAALGFFQQTGFNGEYEQAAFICDAFIPIVNFADPDYTYTMPVFSNQFFSQAMII